MEEFTVFVEFESSPQKHFHFALTDSLANEEIFLSFKNFIQNEIPNVKVARFPGSTKKFIPKQSTNEIANEPFEIYLFGHLIFSRRKTGKPPNFPALVPTIRKLIQEKLETQASQADLAIQNEKPKLLADLKDSKLPPLKMNVNHRAQIKIGKKNYNKPLDYASQTQPTEEAVTISPIKIAPQNNKSAVVVADLNRSEVEKSRSPLRRRIKVTLENLKRAESQPMERDPNREKAVKALNSPAKLTSPYVRRQQKKTSQFLPAGDTNNTQKSPQASPQQKLESPNRGRIKNMGRTNTHFAKLTEPSKNPDTGSNELSEGVASLRAKARLKSASHSSSLKTEGALLDRSKVRSSKERENQPSKPQDMPKQPISKNFQHLTCEDDDSLEEQNPMASVKQENFFLRKTEGDEVNSEEGKIAPNDQERDTNEPVRATADFGQNFKDFLHPSPSTVKRLTIKAHQKSASRYSDMSIEIEDYNKTFDVGIRDSSLSFGELGDEEKEKLTQDASQRQPEKQNKTRPKLETRESKQKVDKALNSAKTSPKDENRKEVAQGSGKKEQLELGDKSFEFNDPIKAHGKRSTPQFAKTHSLAK